MRLLLVVTMLLVVSVSGQDPRSPREALDQRLYDRLAANPMEAILDANRRTDQKLDVITAQHTYLMDSEKIVLQQMQTLLDMRKELYSDTEKLNALADRVAQAEERLQHHEDTSDVRTVAILETKVDAIQKLATWLLGLVSSMLLGAVTFLARRQLTTIRRRLRL